MSDFESIALEILATCETTYWHVPNNVKKEQIHVRSWHVPLSTAKFLHDLVIQTNSKDILELGTSAGFSTIWLAEASKKISGHVDTIEYFKPKYKLANNHFKKAKVDSQITSHNDQILNVLKKMDEEERSFDFIFMDADRGNYDLYFYYLYPMLPKGGMIVVDNAGNYRDRMKRFLKLCEETPHQYSTFLDFDAGLFIFIK
jgi:predicted O-methyltransferase YrrM